MCIVFIDQWLNFTEVDLAPVEKFLTCPLPGSSCLATTTNHEAIATEPLSNEVNNEIIAIINKASIIRHEKAWFLMSDLMIGVTHFSDIPCVW